jgi:hypothetical protein
MPDIDHIGSTTTIKIPAALMVVEVAAIPPDYTRVDPPQLSVEDVRIGIPMVAHG